LPVVAIEPAIKPAVALTRSGVVGVLATRQTVHSAAVARLVTAGVEWAVSGGSAFGGPASTALLPFLTLALPPFVAKLAPEARTQVVATMEAVAGDAADAADEEWAPFFALRQLLVPSTDGAELGAKKRARGGGGASAAARGKTARGGKAQARRGRKARRGGDSETEGSDKEPSDEVEDVSEDDAAPAAKAAKPSPGEWVPFRKPTAPSAAAKGKAPVGGRRASVHDSGDDEDEEEEDAIEEADDDDDEPAPAPRVTTTFGRKKRAALQLDDDEEEKEGGSDSEELPGGVVPAAAVAKKGRR
jgi:hypothetical protein